MARHGWVDPRSGRTTADPNACEITFTNSAGVPVDVMWWSPSDSSYTKLASIQAGATVSQNSFRGHQFKLYSSSRKSNEVKCPGKGGEFELSDNFKLKRAARRSDDL
uniref:von Hippel-Lindau disease tumour suppressor beta domain-containing protein n=1 Tax=Alexandrium catenella TaxID=2925 RepID=A0A7S1S948_ALECA